MGMVAALFAGSFAAQLPDNAPALPPRQVEALINEYADCVVRNDHDAAASAILSDVTDEELVRRYPQLERRSCVPMRLGEFIRVSFTPAQMRDRIAEALFRRDLASLPTPDFENVPPLSHWRVRPVANAETSGRPIAGPRAAEFMAEYQRAELASYLARYGECAVRLDPAGAKALLATQEGSIAEGAAFRAMATAFGTCLSEGRTLNFDKSSLRGSIAVNYYRLASAARNLGSANHHN